MIKAYESSYISHKENIKKLNSDRLYFIKNKNSIGYQQIVRTLKFLSPFLSTKSNWLTIGDLNGLEANYLLEAGQDVTASDISDNFLKMAFDEGLINNYSEVNVESIHYEEDSFDYCFCREAYHHFPRAYIGLYEMIRVCRKATILMEPIDVITKMPMLIWLKNFLDRFDSTLINKVWKNRFSFEPVGNYVFKLSEREVEKVAMGLGLRCIAFHKVNVSYKAVDELILREPYNRKKSRKLNLDIYIRNLLGKLGVIPYNVLIAVVFKEPPNKSVRTLMENSGYQIIDLPENHYLKK